MKTFVLIIVTFCTSLFLLTSESLAQNPYKKNNNSLKFIKKNKTVEVTDINKMISEKFYFVNTSNSDVKIEFVKPDCTCTKYELSKNTIVPQDTAFVELHYDPSKVYKTEKVYATIRTTTKEMYLIGLRVNVK